MKIEEYAARFPEDGITDEQIACSKYLESRGSHFCVHHGFQTCVEQALDLLANEEATEQ
jgi:hypothetical protein